MGITELRARSVNMSVFQHVASGFRARRNAWEPAKRLKTAASVRPSIDRDRLVRREERPVFQPHLGVAKVLKTYIAAKMRLDNLKDRLSQDQSGAALIEYSVLIGLITVAAVTLISTAGATVVAKWTALNGTFK
jgi:pilus assembly protein Flp/PilA